MGFYFCGSEGSPDAARCFMCAKELDGWEKNDDPAFGNAPHSSM